MTQKPAQATPHPDHPVGKGLYPSFDALWHLEKLGIKPDDSTFKAWDEAGKAKEPVRVALIDTPVAYDHPNLRGVIDLGLMRDFTVSSEGHFTTDPVSDEDIASRNEPISLTHTGAAFKKISDLAGTKPPGTPSDRPYHAGAHGTAMAGLIGAWPAEVSVLSPARLWEGDDKARTRTVKLPYVGVNPFCRIVPIATTMAPDPGMVLAALTYARMIRAEVVVIAQAWANPAIRAQKKEKWGEVEDALDDLAKTSLVFCAAGNSGSQSVAYPASLCIGHPNLVAVSACDAKGVPLSYAGEGAKEGTGKLNLLRTLSTEFPRHDRTTTAVVDPWLRPDPDVALPHPADARRMPAEAIITLDVPGPFGYNPSPYQDMPGPDGAWFEIGSLFTRFGGTSAATALAAGLASLALAQKKGNGQSADQSGKQSSPKMVSKEMAEAVFNLDAAKAWLNPQTEGLPQDP